MANPDPIDEIVDADVNTSDRQLDQSSDYYEIIVDGVPVRIATDARQPGGEARSPESFRVTGSIRAAASEIRRRSRAARIR